MKKLKLKLKIFVYTQQHAYQYKPIKTHSTQTVYSYLFPILFNLTR